MPGVRLRASRLDDLEDAPLEDPDGAWDRPELAELLTADPLVVRAGQSGYVQYLDVGKIVEGVMRGAKGGAQTTVVEVPFGPGTFVAAGLPLVKVWPARALLPGVEDEVRDAAVMGKERFLARDFAFGLRQLSGLRVASLCTRTALSQLFKYNASDPRQGKPAARRGRKATGLSVSEVAGLPKGDPLYVLDSC